MPHHPHHKKNPLASFLKTTSVLVALSALVLGVQYLDQQISTKVDASQIYDQSRRRSVQQIPLQKGWNLISFNVTPNSLKISDILSVFQRRNGNYFLMAKNNAGQVYWPEYGIDQIDTVNLEEGYWLFLNKPAHLTVYGKPITLPFVYYFQAGWNGMSYPLIRPSNALQYVKPLIDSGQLVVLQDLEGRKVTQENGNWVNQIGQLKPGVGYQINVNQAATLTIQ